MTDTHPAPTRLYHNPRCSKSRGALELLRERGVEPEIVPYLEQPPSASELRALLELLGSGPRAMLRSGEPVYAELGMADPALDDEALVAAMAAHTLSERPSSCMSFARDRSPDRTGTGPAGPVAGLAGRRVVCFSGTACERRKSSE